MTSKIEWLRSADGRPGYTVNPIKGLCPMACPYCYARRMYKRFHWPEEITFDNRAFNILEKIKIPSRIFIGSTMELFGEWVGADAANYIIRQVRNFPQHTFIFLTKQPQNLIEWSPFPSNCFIGVSVCNDKMLDVAVDKLEDIQAEVKFISFEPLLEKLTLSLDYAFYYSGISLVIIGQQTPVKQSTTPKIEWIREIVEAADKAGIPVFLKNNLGWPKYSDAGSPPFYKKEPTGVWVLRQEFPST